MWYSVLHCNKSRKERCNSVVATGNGLRSVNSPIFFSPSLWSSRQTIVSRPLITRWILMEMISKVIVRLIEGVWGYLLSCASSKPLGYFHVCASTEEQKEKEGEREREREEHGSSKNAKSIRGFVTFQSLDSFQSFQRNRSSARLFRVLNSTV